MATREGASAARKKVPTPCDSSSRHPDPHDLADAPRGSRMSVAAARI